MEDFKKILEETRDISTRETLTDEEKARIDALWGSSEKPPTFKDLVTVAAQNGNVDTRTRFGRAVRDYLTTTQRRPFMSRDTFATTKTKDIVLTDEMKETILNNAHQNNSAELARIIFGDPNIGNLDAKVRAVAQFLKDRGFQKGYYNNPHDVPQSDYVSPNTLDKACCAVNRVVSPKPALDPKRINIKTRKDLIALMGYLRTFRFVHLMNSYECEQDRSLFESSFIRHTYDKDDLTEEEVDQYMSLAADIVISASIQRRAEKLRRLIDEATESNDPDKQKFSISLVEAIDKMQNELHRSETRQQKLLSDLKGKRSERIDALRSSTGSILNFFELWSEEETRKKLIKVGMVRNERVKETMDKLETMDDIIARVYGLSQEEVLE